MKNANHRIAAAGFFDFQGLRYPRHRRSHADPGGGARDRSALGSLAWKVRSPAIAVGRDGRLSGPKLRDALIHGITSTGIDVIDVGMVPTPVLYFATHQLKPAPACRSPAATIRPSTTG